MEAKKILDCYENTRSFESGSLSKLFDSYLQPQGFESTYQPLSLSIHVEVIEIVGAKFLIARSPRRHMVNDDQDAVTNCNQRLLFAYPPGQPSVLCGQVCLLGV